MILDYANFLSELYRFIRAHTDIAIVGMSGGADSSLVSILLCEALGEENVISLHMPASFLDSQSFNHDSLELAKRLKIKATLISLEDSIKSFVDDFEAREKETPSKITIGNFIARQRMAHLYASANHVSESTSRRVRVAGTGNLSEIYIGYDTKGGDAIADFFPIGNVFKSEVFQLLEYFASQGKILPSHINRTPSAGLWPGQSDESELGASYDEIECGIRKCLTMKVGRTCSSKTHSFVEKRHLSNRHKYVVAPSFPSIERYNCQ